MRRCDGIDRREFLRIGGLSALGLGLADVLRLRATAAPGPHRNCILVWLDGGPSHLDTFDLKPDAPEEVRGPFQPIPTKVAGIQISEHFHRLATTMDKVCLIRSMTSELGEHNLGSQYLLTGYKPSPVLEYPTFGAVAAHVRGGRTALPPFIAVPEYARVAGSGHGYLPPATRPFAVGGDPSRPDFRVRDLDPPSDLDADRLLRRRDFLSALDEFHRAAEGGAVPRDHDAYVEQAYRLVLSPVVKQSFDLARESTEVRNRYGRSRVGQSCLLARRLVEAGCPFVTVTDTGWDSHAQIYRQLKEGFVGGSAGKVPILDQALAALLTDLNDRGLLATTLVLVMGEFGRTPKLNTNAGRDHWPRAFSVLLAGGGVRGGQVVGASDARGEVPADRPVTPADLARTVYMLLGIDPDLELHTRDGRPVRVAVGKIVRECVG
jgi:hypothetical protein